MADFKAIQQLDLNLLKVFESLYTEQNMTRTAEALHITPSAVSHAIKRLRDCLQDPLFQRSQQRMLPTPACQRMAPLIIDNLSRLRQILQQWGDFDPLSSHHHFRIGMHDAIELSLLPKLVKTFTQLAPNITFASIKTERNQLARDLAAGHIDVALDVALPVKPPVMHLSLLDDTFCVLMHKDHEQSDGFDLDAYLNADHLVVSTRPTGAAMEDLQLQAMGYARRQVVRCQNYFAAREILKSRRCLLTLPSRLARELKDEQLHVQALPLSLAPMTTHLYWHANTQDDAALSWLREVLQHQFS